MNVKELTEYIVKSLVKDKDNVETVNIYVSESDLGIVIGRAGKVANAIRTIIQAAGYANNKKNIKINIDKKD